MHRLVLFLIIRYAFAENYTDTREINDMEYSQESTIIGEEAEFSFTIFNTTYARDVLGIDSYCFSVTFIGEKFHEKRLPEELLPTNEIKYQRVLKMEGLEEEGNYLICVFFFNQSNLIASSRFCDVVSVGSRCNLEPHEALFGNRHVLILLAFVVFILTATVLFSCIRDYIYRPRTIEAILKTLPDHHAQNLEVLAPVADNRRRRRTQQELNNRLREDSVLTVDYQPNGDNEYLNYYGIDNASLDVLPE